MKRVDVMVDIETLGTGLDSTVFQIAAIAFDINSGEHLSLFNRIADISENESYEMNVSGDTLKWWLNTDKDLLTHLLNEGEGSSSKLLVHFHEWLRSLSLTGELHLWGNGILFDNNIIRHQFEQLGLKYPINYKRDRDVRTIIDLACSKLGIDENELKDRFKDETLTAHDAFDDVKKQINLVVYSYTLITS